MNKKLVKKLLKSNKNGAITGAALIFIALAQIPGAIKHFAEVACIGQSSNMVWHQESNHAEANILAVNRCNGSN